MSDLAEQIRNETANLSNLSGANLTRANLTRANLCWANLHWANLSGANLTRAHLYGANLTEANLTEANLTGADLTRANLCWANLHWANLYGAYLSDVNLSCCAGVVWAQVGPIGTDLRTLTAVVQTWGDVPTPQTVFHAGCFHGTPTEFFAACEAGGKDWGWPEDDYERLRDECVEAGRYLEQTITRQLDLQAAS